MIRKALAAPIKNADPVLWDHSTIDEFLLLKTKEFCLLKIDTWPFLTFLKCAKKHFKKRPVS